MDGGAQNIFRWHSGAYLSKELGICRNLYDFTIAQLITNDIFSRVYLNGTRVSRESKRRRLNGR